jgi:hypothetical protein
MASDQPNTSARRASVGEPTTNLVRTFVQILLLEAVILVGLWWFSRAYS